MSEPPANQEMDLRSELQNVQQRMKKTEAIGNSLQQAAKELEDHIKNQNGSTSDEQGQLLKQKLSSLQDEYDQIIKDGQLLSKPSVSILYILPHMLSSDNQETPLPLLPPSAQPKEADAFTAGNHRQSHRTKNSAKPTHGFWTPSKTGIFVDVKM